MWKKQTMSHIVVSCKCHIDAHNETVCDRGVAHSHRSTHGEIRKGKKTKQNKTKQKQTNTEQSAIRKKSFGANTISERHIADYS